MLSIIKKPKDLVLAGQPVAYDVQSTSAQTPLRIAAYPSGQNDGDSIAVDANGIANFELSDYLQGLITERYKTDATPQIYANVPKPMQFNFVELGGSPPVTINDLISPGIAVLDGSVPESRRRLLYSQFASVLDYLKASKSCLTWWNPADIIKVQPTQKVFLNYLQVFSLNTIDVTVNLMLKFTDGTYSNLMAQHTISNLSYLKLLYVPTGYVELDIAEKAAMFTTKTLRSWVISINYGPPNHSERISQPYEFMLDDKYYENIRYLYIRNAFGLYEIVKCTGTGEQINEIKIEIATTDGRILPDKISWKTTRSFPVTVNTGFLSKTEMQWLSDFNFIDAFEMIDGITKPIVFHDLKLPAVHDQDYQYSAELEYEYAFNEIDEIG